MLGAGWQQLEPVCSYGKVYQDGSYLFLVTLFSLAHVVYKCELQYVIWIHIHQKVR